MLVRENPGVSEGENINFDISLYFEESNFKHAFQKLFLLLITVVNFSFINDTSFAVIIFFIAVLHYQFTFSTPC